MAATRVTAQRRAVLARRVVLPLVASPRAAAVCVLVPRRVSATLEGAGVFVFVARR